MGDQMIQIVGPMPSVDELRAKIRHAQQNAEAVGIEASASGHWEGQTPVFDVILTVGDEAFHGSLAAEYDGTGALTFSVGADIHFEIVGKQAALNAAVGYDVVNHSWNIQSGATLDITDRWSMSANYTIDSSGKQQALLTLTFRF